MNTPRREKLEQGEAEDPRRKMNAGSAEDSVTGRTSVVAEEETAETVEEIEMEVEEETLTEEEMTQEIAVDHLPDMVVDAAEAIQERLRDVRDAALDASNVDTSKPIAPREVVVVASETQEETLVAMVVTGAETTEVGTEMNLAATTQEVALLLVEVIGITIAHPLGTEAHPNIVVTIAMTAEAPHATTSERRGALPTIRRK